MTATFAIYDATGRILRTGYCPTSMLDIQAGEGEFLYVGSADEERQYINTSTGDLADKPVKPDGRYEFNSLTKTWDVVIPTVAETELEVRVRRNMLLTGCDWTQLPDVPLAIKDAWVSYRQALRDITTQSGFPLDIVWPTPPI